jgi:hypothetical protein
MGTLTYVGSPDHTGPVGEPFDTLNLYSWQPEQQCRTDRHGPWFPSSVRKRRNFRLRKAKGLLMQRHAL